MTGSFDRDTVDYSNSKGKAAALPLRNENDNILDNIDRDAGMEDAISPRVDHEHHGPRFGGDHHDSGEDVDIDNLESRNKRKAGENQNEDSESFSDEEISQEDHDKSLDRRGDGYHDSDTFALDGGPTYGRPARFLWAEPVDLPVQEVRMRKDGGWDIRPGGK